MPPRPSPSSRLRVTALILAVSLATGGLAKPVTIADTSYQLEVPESFNISRPPGALDILLQADRPDGKGTIQVVRRPGNNSPDQLVAGYESQMQQALGNLNLQQENMRTVAGRSCIFRRYQSVSGGLQIRVQALFYADGNQGFIIHAIDTAIGAPEFERAIVSLQAPQNPTAATATKPTTSGAGAERIPAGQQTIGQTSYTFVPPAGWQSLPASQNPGLQFALPEKGAVMELTWVEVDDQVGDAASFLDQTLGEVESGFGAGWHERERSPHRSGDSQLLFKRFGGQIGQQPAELMILGVTDRRHLVLAYGYFAELGLESAGPAMREAILSIKAADTRTASAVPPPAPSSGWSTPPAPSSAPSKAIAPPPPAHSVIPPPPAPTGIGTGRAAGPGYEPLVIDDSGFEFNKPTAFTLAQRAEGQTQWADPNATGAKIVLVIQTMMRRAGNSADSVRDSLLDQVQNSSAAQLQSSASATLNGLRAHQLHFTLNRGGEPQHFRYVVLDLPGPNVATVSFVAPASLAATAERHFDEVLRTMHTTTTTAAIAPPPPPPPSTPYTATTDRGPAEPDSSEAAYFALASAVAQGRWDWVVAHLTDRAKLEFCRRCRDEIRDADLTEADAIDDPTGTSRAYLQWGTAQKVLAAYFESNRTISGIRAESADWHLLMTKKPDGGDHYLWFKRINGRWMFDY